MRDYTEGYNVHGFSETPSAWSRFRRAARRGDLVGTAVRYATERAPFFLLWKAVAARRRRGQGNVFTVGEEAFPYSYDTPPGGSRWGAPWLFAGERRPRPRNDLLSERTVEIPFARAFVRRFGGGRGLEVGHVLSARGPLPGEFTIVDKYETGPGVVNEDIATYRATGKFDLIVSVSTIEHVGFDEPEKDPSKPAHVLERLTSFLAPSGRMLVTLPIGYNPVVDALLTNAGPEGSRVTFLRRISSWNEWAESTPADALRQRYGQPYPCANAVAFLEWGYDRERAGAKDSNAGG